MSITDITKALNKLFEPMGIEAFFSNDWDGIENGIHFKNIDTGERILLSNLQEKIATHINHLESSASDENFNDLNAQRIKDIGQFFIEGDTGITAAFVSSYAVISDYSSNRFQEIVKDINEITSENEITVEREALALEKLVSGEGTEWGDVFSIDRKGFKSEDQKNIAIAFNWLEKYDPSFKETLWHIKQGQAVGKIRGVVDIKRTEDYGAWADWENDEILLSLNPGGYLGEDGRLYETSLNETLAHETRHIAQKNYLDIPQILAEEESLRAKITVNYQEIKSYLANKELSDYEETARYYDYAGGYDNGSDYDREPLDPKIINDPKFTSLANAYRQARIKVQEHIYNYEDDAIDAVNDLRSILGKSHRGHYHDSNIFYDQISHHIKHLVVYEDTPEKIKENGVLSWSISEDVVLYPLITGQLGPRDSSITELQKSWINKYDNETRNLNSQEEIVLADARRQAFSGDLDNLSASEKSKLDRALGELVKEFNISSDFDKPSKSTLENLNNLYISIKFD